VDAHLPILGLLARNPKERDARMTSVTQDIAFPSVLNYTV